MIRRKDLVDIGDADYKERQGEFMECQDCGETAGGTRGDYFQMSMDYAITCWSCGSGNIALVRKVCKNVIVKQ